MAIQNVSVHVEGVAPLMLHNGQLANPRNEFAKAMKVLTSKRKKTDADYDEIARLEHMGGLYLDDKGRAVIPGEMIEATVVNGAKKNRLGEQFKAGMWCEGNWPLLYDGPRAADALFADKRFVDERLVIVAQSRVMRCRPIFAAWGVKFTLCFHDDVLNEGQIEQAIDAAGLYCGFGDHTPRYGRFIRKQAGRGGKAA